MRKNRFRKIMTTSILSLSIFITGFISPVINTYAKETLTFEDEREISDYIKSKPFYYHNSLRTVGNPWLYDDTYKSVHLQDGIYSPTPTDNSHKFLDFRLGGSNISVETDYNWNINTYVGTGQHLYSYEMTEGDIMPVSSWECFGNPTAIHHVNYLPSVASHVTGDWYNYDGVICKNDTIGNSSCDVKNAKWYETMNYTLQENGIYGFGQIIMTEEYIRNGNNFSTVIYDYPAYRCKCAICGDYLTNVFFECPENCLADIKYIEIGTHVITKCRACGALENEGHTCHTCKAISDNRYYIVYEDGTNDPNVYGSQKDTVFYANNSVKFEGAMVINKHILSPCKLIRPGYTFAGWSLEDDGTPDYTALQDIYTCDFYEDILIANPDNNPDNNNNAKITLYACWKAEEAIIHIDVNTNNVWGNSRATIYGEEESLVKNTIHKGRTVGSDNKALDNAGKFENNILTINSSNITTPKGSKVTFVTDGSSVASVYENTKVIGYTREIIQDNSPTYIGLNQNNISNTYNNGYLSEINYIFTKAPIEEKLCINYEAQGIILPESSKENTLFVGWYTTPTFEEGTFVGSKGNRYYPEENITLYAKFSEIKVEISDVYYSTSTPSTYGNTAMKNDEADNAYSTPDSELAVNYAKGAINIKVTTENIQ